MTRPSLNDPIYLNGIDAETGTYLSEPAPAQQWLEVIKRQGTQRDPLDDLRYRVQARQSTTRGVLPEYGDGSDLGKAGWGIIFPAQADPEQVQSILRAMGCLVERRKAQAGARFRIYQGRDGFRWNRGRPESKNDFLQHNGVGVGPVNPNRMPYYLLIVADPQSIPFRFQYELDVQYAVGRIYFQTLDEYAAYARSLVMAEDARPQASPRAVFFGVANPDDPATQTSAENLVTPLYQYAAEKACEPGMDWQAELVPPAQADRQTLLSLLGGARTPAFLLTAGHGWGWQQPNPLQTRYQGALICQDWQGPRAEKVSRAHVVAGEDIPTEAVLTGSIIFHFACYSAGTPYLQDTGNPARRPQKPAAYRPFLSALPTRLLGLPEGGALAVIGHVERAWAYSFQWGQLDAQTQSYQSLLFQLMSGKPVGLAMEQMNQRYAEMATMLAHDLAMLAHDPAESSAAPDAVDPMQLFSEWTATNDARSYVILGDPAARIAVHDAHAPAISAPAALPRQHFPGRLPPIFTPNALAPFSEDERQAILQEETAYASAPEAPSETQPKPFGQASKVTAVQVAVPGDEAPAPPEPVMDRLREKAAELLRGLDGLEISTQAAGEASCRLITRIRADGSLETTHFSVEEEEISPELLRTHEAMVHQAIERQVELLKELNRLLEKI